MKNVWFLLLLTGVCLGCVEKHSSESEEDIDIIAEYEKRFYNPHRAEFIEWMKTHPESLDMDLSEQAELADVQIEESTDGNVRVYSWISGGGTSPDWTNFTQYRDSEGHVRIIDGLPMQYDAGGGTITTILYAGILNGEKAYFFDYYSKSSSQEGYNSLYPSVMKADTFALGPRFLCNGETSESVGLSYTISDWYFRTNGEGWEQMFHFDKDAQRLFVIKTDERRSLTGFYDVYDFDSKNNVFRLVGESGSPFLHPSIRELDFLVNVFETEHHLVRVDRMKDDTYRMTLWDNPSFAKQTDKPSLVLTGGNYLPDANSYVFKVDDNLTYVYNDDEQIDLMLYYQGKLLYDDKEKNYRSDAVAWTEGFFDDDIEGLPETEAVKLMLTTEHYIVRVDSTTDGHYRYASWKHFPFWEGLGKPDIVLNNGKKRMVDYEEYYEFRNGKYVYRVPTDERNRLKVTKDGVKVCDDWVWEIITEAADENEG